MLENKIIDAPAAHAIAPAPKPAHKRTFCDAGARKFWYVHQLAASVVQTWPAALLQQASRCCSTEASMGRLPPELLVRRSMQACWRLCASLRRRTTRHLACWADSVKIQQRERAQFGAHAHCCSDVVRTSRYDAWTSAKMFKRPLLRNWPCSQPDEPLSRRCGAPSSREGRGGPGGEERPPRANDRPACPP